MTSGPVIHPAAQPEKKSGRTIAIVLVSAGVLALGLVLWGCWNVFTGVSSRAAEADAAVQRFHDDLNHDRLHEIYARTDNLFRSKTSMPQAIVLFEGVHRKLGNVTSSKRTSLNVQTTL